MNGRSPYDYFDELCDLCCYHLDIIFSMRLSKHFCQELTENNDAEDESIFGNELSSSKS